MIIPDNESNVHEAQQAPQATTGRRIVNQFLRQLVYNGRTLRSPYTFGAVANPFRTAASNDNDTDSGEESRPADSAGSHTIPRLGILKPPQHSATVASMAGPSLTDLESLAPSVGPGFVGLTSVRTIIDIFEPVRVFIFLRLEAGLSEPLLSQDRHKFAFPRPSLSRLHDNWSILKRAAVCDTSGPFSPYRLTKPTIRRDLPGAKAIWEVVDYLANSTKEHFAASIVSGFCWTPATQAETVLVSAGRDPAFRDLYTKHLATPSPLMKELTGVSELELSDPSIAAWDYMQETMHENRICSGLLDIIETLVSRRTLS